MDVDKQEIVPAKERKALQVARIKTLYKLGYSMTEICTKENCSKTTVFFAIKGRSKKKK